LSTRNSFFTKVKRNDRYSITVPEYLSKLHVHSAKDASLQYQKKHRKDIYKAEWIDEKINAFAGDLGL